MSEVNFLLRNKNKFATIVIVLFLAVVALFTIVKYTVNGNRVMVSPGAKQAVDEQTSRPSAPLFNPPQEIKYDSSTDLKKELDAVDPKVLDEDFE